MATVYLARDLRHDREVAIKVLHPELAASIGKERFEREIKLSAKLQHPHILGLIDSGEAGGLLYYVMPFVRGESLRDRLDREGQLPIEDAVQIAHEVADALGHAHAQGIVHRDIKPENILLSGGHALVADFGIARAATEAGGQKLTQTGMAVGTPVYMAPEQAVGHGIGPASDLYSLGCVLYEMLAGEPPFTAKNPQALMARHAMEAVPSIRIVRTTVPEEIEDTIFASMAKVPADRPQTAAQFAELLGAPLGATAAMRATIRHTAARRVPTGAHTTLRVEAPPWWRRPWVPIVAVLILVGGSLAGLQLFARARGASLSTEERERLNQIAVLYFDHPSSDSTLAPVAEGLTDALIASLRQANVAVRGTQSVVAFRGKQVAEDSIARALGVGTLVKGSVEPSGSNEVTVTTWLVDARGNILSGSRTSFSVPRDSLFKAEENVARQAADALRSLVGASIDLTESRARAGNLAAWTLYQRAEKTRKDAEQARADPPRAIASLASADSLVQLAAAADPQWVDPLLLRAEVARQRASLDSLKSDKAKWLQTGKSYVEQALARNPEDPNGLALRGTLSYAEWRLALTSGAARDNLLNSAKDDVQRAVLIDNKLATAYATLAQINHEQKDISTELKNARLAYEADQYLRNADAILAQLFWGNYNLQQIEDAQSNCADGHRRFPRDYRFVICSLWLQLAPNVRAEVPEAWRLAALVDSQVPATRFGQLQSHLAHMVVGGIIGKVAKGAGAVATGPLADSAKRVLERSLGDPELDPTQELVGYQALMLTQMGELDRAIDLLKRYVALNRDHSFRVGGNVHWWWRDLTNKPEFISLMARGN